MKFKKMFNLSLMQNKLFSSRLQHLIGEWQVFPLERCLDHEWGDTECTSYASWGLDYATARTSGTRL